MLKCPFCGFDNEDGSLFCEQCKSDLSSVEAPKPVEPVPVAAVVEEAVPMAQSVPMAEAVEVPQGAAATAQATPPAAAETAPSPGAKLPEGAQPKLVVIRGLKIGIEYPIYPDLNFIGRADEKPVDIDLDDQESPDRVWVSRQHALITFEEGALTLEDLNSSNGTYVNRTRVYPGQKQPLNPGDVIQVGTVQMKLKV
jgi:hypothetical protein